MTETVDSRITTSDERQMRRKPTVQVVMRFGLRHDPYLIIKQTVQTSKKVARSSYRFLRSFNLYGSLTGQWRAKLYFFTPRYYRVMSKAIVKTTFEASRTLRPIYTGGSTALDASGRILLSCVGEDALIVDLETGNQLASLEGVCSVTLEYSSIVKR